MSFLDLHDRLLRLRNDQISPEDAQRDLQTIAGEAARQYRSYASEGRQHFDLKWCTPEEDPSPFSPTNDVLWHGVWRAILIRLAVTFPHRMPSLSTLEAPEIVEDNVFEGGRARVLRHPPGRWRQRVEHHAAGCQLLAELAGEGDKAPDKPLDSISVDLERDANTITLGDVVYGATRAQAYVVSVLLDANGAWVKSRHLKEYGNTRVDRIIKRLEKPIRDRIKSKKGLGYRLT